MVFFVVLLNKMKSQIPVSSMQISEYSDIVLFVLPASKELFAFRKIYCTQISFNRSLPISFTIYFTLL